MRCKFKNCKKKINILKFKCKFCSLDFCLTHQIPEIHSCKLCIKENIILPKAIIPDKISTI